MNISGLKPSTSYYLQCTAAPDDIGLRKSHSRVIPFLTSEGIHLFTLSCAAYFQIRQIHRWKRRVTYHVASNMNAPIACYIMTKKRSNCDKLMIVAEILDTYESSTVSKHRIVFSVPSAYTPLLTKCEMYDAKNNSTLLSFPNHPVILSTSVEEIPPLVSFWKIFGLIALISCLGGLAYYLWVNRQVDDPSLSMYVLEFELKYSIRQTDSEPISIFSNHDLSLNPSKIEESSLLEERKGVIACKRCGYLNNEKSVVCKECNALLKGTDMFQGTKKRVYY